LIAVKEVSAVFLERLAIGAKYFLKLPKRNLRMVLRG